MKREFIGWLKFLKCRDLTWYIMKHMAKILLWVIAIPVVLLVMLVSSLYLPPVQRAAWHLAEQWVAQNTTMQLSLGYFSLRFPLRIEVGDVLLIDHESDTLFRAESMRSGVALLPLLDGKVMASKVELQEAHINYAAADSSMHILADVGLIALPMGDIILADNAIAIERIELKNSHIDLHYCATPDTAAQDTTSGIAWNIAVGRIDIADVAVNIAMPQSIDSINVLLPRAAIVNSHVAMANQVVTVNNIAIDGGNYRYIDYSTDDKSEQATKAQEHEPDTTSKAWRVEVGGVSLTDNAAAYITRKSTPTQGLDLSHIAVHKVCARVSDIYYHGSAMHLQLDNLALQERSGLSVTHTCGRFAISDEGTLSLSDFSLATPLSEIKADAAMGLSFFDHDPRAEVKLHATARLACRDITTLLPSAGNLFLHSPQTEATHSQETINAEIAIDGMAQDINVARLDILQAGVFDFNAKAHVKHPLDKQRRNIALSCRFDSHERLSLNNFITDILLSHQLAVQPIEAQFDATLQGSDLTANALAYIAGGSMQADARCNLERESYKADVTLRQLPLSLFMPHDTVGDLSMTAHLSGRHFAIDNPRFRLQAGAQIDTLDYRNYLYRNINLSARMRRQQWSVKLHSPLPEADIEVDAQGIFNSQLVTADVNARIGNLDAKALALSQKQLDVAGTMRASVVLSDIDSIVQADVTIDNLAIGYNQDKYKAESISLLAASDITYSYLDLRNGDLQVSLSSDTGLKHLRPGMERLTQLVDTILLTQRLDMDEFHRGMPPFDFSAEMKSNNLLQAFLNAQGMSMSSAYFNASNDTLFNISSMVHRMRVSGMLLDTITFDAHEQDARLNYRLALNNRPGNMDEFAHVHVEGFLSGNSTRLYLLQNNRAGEVGFLFGSKIEFLADRIELTLGPKSPIIGYKKWKLNEGNYVTFNHALRQLDADVKLSYGDSHLYITTDDRRNKQVSGAHIDVQNIELAHWFTVSPLVTPMSGVVSANLYVDVPSQGIEAAGTLDIRDLTYNYTPMGTFHADVNYTLAKRGGNNISLSVLHNAANVLAAQLYLDNSARKAIDGTIEIKALPMSVADAFVHAKGGRFTGTLNSQLRLQGTLTSPQVDGYVRLDDATTAFDQYGVALTFDNSDIKVKRSHILLDEYAMRGANNNPLTIDGDIDFSNMMAIAVALDVKGRNFQPVGIAENRTGMLYGSVYTDVYATVRGTLNNLRMNGYVSLLSGTDATYIMQSNHAITGNDYSDMVSFVSFDDVYATQELHKKHQYRNNTFAANIDINLDAGVRLGINMSADGKNRIDLIGGGNLLYSATALGDTRVSGRYTLTGGYVRYAPPFLSSKLFNIQEGSYVTWNGALTDPSFNITAVQSQYSTVKSGDNTHSVDFDITLKITNSLNNLGITFDLSTDEDLTIANELKSMTVEQREAKAMNMLLYNSYTTIADAAQNILIDNTLNTFLEYELNNWAQRTLRGVDLSFGISDRGFDASGNQRTDYSYRFSKTLFDNRLKVVLGGSYASNQDVAQNFNENLIDDISLEYRLDKRENMYLKVFRHRGYESIIEGEITETGAGFLYRKQVKSLLDLFRKKPSTTTTIKESTSPPAPADSVTMATPDTVTILLPDTILATDSIVPIITQQPITEP